MEQLPTPHNNFFQFALSHLPNARSLIETQVSAKALAELNLDTLQLETGSFIDADLSEKFSDMLLSARRRGGDADGERALVYFLFEHKSQSDPLTAFQLVRYVLRIHERRLREGLPLCPVVPLIVYHGEGGWTAAKSLQELIPASVGFADYQINFRPLLLDLSQLADDEIAGEPVLQGTLRLLKYSRSKELPVKFEGIMRFFAKSLPDAWLGEWILAIGVYVMSVNNKIDSQQYKQTLKTVFPTQFEPGSLADRLLIQGREEGMEKGIEKGIEKGALIGKIQMLQELLGDRSAVAEELRGVGVEELSVQLAELQQRLRARS